MSKRQSQLTLLIDGQAGTDTLYPVLHACQTAQLTDQPLWIVAPPSVQRECRQQWSARSQPQWEIDWHWLESLADFDWTQLQTDWLGVIPGGAVLPVIPPRLPAIPGLMPWLPAVELPQETAREQSLSALAWLGATALLSPIAHQLKTWADWTLLQVGQYLDQQQMVYRWYASPVVPSSGQGLPASAATLTVLAIVPHYQCEPWLAQCLRSLIHQTRSLDGIVVIDDGSAVPPLEIVHQFPQVTLLAAPTRVGPYRLVQQVIEATTYETYLFQDADDWSSCDRLEILLHLLQTTAADLVGTQEIRVDAETGQISLGCYPLDVSAALATKPGHPLLHPTSLVRRDLVQRVGGFATGLQFGGDTEFLLRSRFVATIANSPQWCYFRRKRSHSLTTAPATGLASPARQALLTQLKQRAVQHQIAVTTGLAPDLTPLAIAEPILLRHLAGPRLKWAKN